MPNETQNCLEIQGDQTLIDSFINTHKKTNKEYDIIYWDFSKSVPIDLNNDEYIQEKTWGTYRGIVSHINNNKIYIETPWRSCDLWFESMIVKYPNLNFILTYNDEYSEDFYGWIVACQGNIIRNEEICLHQNAEHGGIDLYKFYKK